MDIIESYYAVARDLEARGRWMLDAAETCAQIADKMSEARMRAKDRAEQQQPTAGKAPE